MNTTISRQAVLATVFILVLICFGRDSFSAGKIVVGWVERVHVNGVSIAAKIDSGADNTSINMVNPHFYTRQGKKRVRFTVVNGSGKLIRIDNRIVRYVRIKKKSRTGAQRRPVIMLRLCLAGVSRTVKVNLVDRSRYKFQLLVGRSFLAPHFLIDPALKYTNRQSCKKPAS